MPHEPTTPQKLIMKIRRWPISRKIKTIQDAQMVRDLLEKELLERKQFFEQYKDNFSIQETDKEIKIIIFGPNKQIIGQIKISPWPNNIWYISRAAIGQFRTSRDKYRDLGFGKALIYKLFEEAKKIGIKQIIGDVLNKNVKLFESMGAKISPKQEFKGTTRMYFDLKE